MAEQRAMGPPIAGGASGIKKGEPMSRLRDPATPIRLAVATACAALTVAVISIAWALVFGRRLLLAALPLCIAAMMAGLSMLGWLRFLRLDHCLAFTPLSTPGRDAWAPATHCRSIAPTGSTGSPRFRYQAGIWGGPIQ